MRAGSVVLVVAGVSFLCGGCGRSSVRGLDAGRDSRASQGGDGPGSQADGPGADEPEVISVAPDAPAADVLVLVEVAGDVSIPVEVAGADAPVDVPITDLPPAERPAGADASLDSGDDTPAGEAGRPSPRSTMPPFDNCPGAFPRARLALDEAGTLYLGLICYVSGDTGPLRIVLMVSHDLGVSFDGPWPVIDLDSGAFDANALLGAGPAGQVYVAAPNSGGVLFLRSTDAGKTWPSPQQLPQPVDNWNLQLVAIGDAVGVGPVKSGQGGVASVLMSSDRGASLVEVPLGTAASTLLADAKRSELLVVSAGGAVADAGALDGDVLQSYQVARWAADTRTLVDTGVFLRAGTIYRWGVNDGTLYALVDRRVWRGKPDGTTDGSFVPYPESPVDSAVDFAVEVSGSVVLRVETLGFGDYSESLVRWDESAGSRSAGWSYSSWNMPHFRDISFVPLGPSRVALTGNASFSASYGSIELRTHTW